MMMRSMLAAAGITLAFAATAAAQEWPAKPIRVIVPVGAGAGPDIVPRIVLEQVGQQIGQTFVFENRPGAGTTTGTAAVARADADGYTLLATSSSLSTAPALYQNLTYNTTKDLAGIAQFGALPMNFVVHPDAPYKTVADFVTFAKSGQKPINFATTGVGSSPHLAAERFRLSAGFEAKHVPFKSGAEALTEIIAARVEFYFCPIGTALPVIQDGRIVGLAVSTPKRTVALPNVPTTLEAGYANSDYTFWVGMFAPAKTPRAVIERLHAETVRAMDVPSVRQRLAQNGVEPLAMTPAELDAFVAAELPVNAKLVQTLGLKGN